MIRFTAHAIERYMERVRPGVDRDHAFRELRRLSGIGSVEEKPPDWIAPEADDEDATRWLVCGDVVFPLVCSDTGSGWAATTCLTRGSIPAKSREVRNHRRRGRQDARRYHRNKRIGEYGKRRPDGGEPEPEVA